MASRLARMQADRGLPLVTQRHDSLNTDEFCRWVLWRLDGKHDRNALSRELRREVNAGRVTIRPKGGRPTKSVDGPTLTRTIDGALEWASRSGLLVE